MSRSFFDLLEREAKAVAAAIEASVKRVSQEAEVLLYRDAAEALKGVEEWLETLRADFKAAAQRAEASQEKSEKDPTAHTPVDEGNA